MSLLWLVESLPHKRQVAHVVEDGRLVLDIQHSGPFIDVDLQIEWTVRHWELHQLPIALRLRIKSCRVLRWLDLVSHQYVLSLLETMIIVMLVSLESDLVLGEHVMSSPIWELHLLVTCTWWAWYHVILHTDFTVVDAFTRVGATVLRLGAWGCALKAAQWFKDRRWLRLVCSRDALINVRGWYVKWISFSANFRVTCVWSLSIISVLYTSAIITTLYRVVLEDCGLLPLRLFAESFSVLLHRLHGRVRHVLRVTNTFASESALLAHKLCRYFCGLIFQVLFQSALNHNVSNFLLLLDLFEDKCIVMVPTT